MGVFRLLGSLGRSVSRSSFSHNYLLGSALLGLCMTGAAWAVVAPDYLPTKAVPSSVCFLNFYNPNSGGIMTPKAGCTGTLIRPNRLLTAAHCLPNLNPSDGSEISLAIECGGNIFGVAGYKADPAYNDGVSWANHYHDVAIIGVEGNTSKIKPMELATTDAQVQAQLVNPNACILAGYGRGDDSANSSWGTLRAAEFNYVTPATIESEFGWDIPAQELFTAPDHAAPGDSGGPVYCPQADGSFLQIGVTMLESEPTGGSQVGEYMSIHESVVYDLDWINATANLAKLPNN